MSKAMTRAMGGHNLRVMMVIVALAAMLFVLTLVAVVQRAPTTSSGNANHANPAMGVDEKGGSSITQDSSIERHAKVVQGLGDDSVRQAPR
jgi:hypothetical protein